MILMNPLYNGWIVRHRRSDRESRNPAPWRANPPVSDELWARVEDVRRGKTRGGGAKRHDRVDLLGGLLECVCGLRIRNDGTFGDGRHRKLHVTGEILSVHRIEPDRGYWRNTRRDPGRWPRSRATE